LLGGTLLRLRHPRAGRNQARLQLAQTVRVLGELRSGFRLQAVASRQPLGGLLETIGGALDEPVALCHFLVGGSSPVATRHTREAARLAAIVAAAPKPA